MWRRLFLLMCNIIISAVKFDVSSCAEAKCFQLRGSRRSNVDCRLMRYDTVHSYRLLQHFREIKYLHFVAQ
jgi:hypothetical protein